MLDEVRDAGGRRTYPGLRLLATAETLARGGLVRIRTHTRKGSERGEGPHTDTLTVVLACSPETGVRLREARQAAGLTQGQLAERVGASRSTVSALERDKRTHTPSVDLALAIAREVGWSVESLWRGPDTDGGTDGHALYALYAARFAYRHPLPWRALHEHERQLWSSLAADVQRRLQACDEPDDLLSQAAHGVREREAHRTRQA